MVYFAADIDLGSAAMADLEQMKAAGSSGEVDLLAQLNSGGSQSIRRYHLQKDTYLQEDLITNRNANGEEQLLYNVDAKRDLIDFVEWCATRSEAEHYALILWDMVRAGKRIIRIHVLFPAPETRANRFTNSSRYWQQRNVSLSTSKASVQMKMYWS